MALSRIQFGFTVDQIIKDGRITREDIKQIKQWLFNQNLPALTDEQLVTFLLSCNNVQTATQTTIQMNNFIKNRAPDIFNNRRVNRSDLQRGFNSGRYCVFPETTDDGYVVVYQAFEGNFRFWNIYDAVIIIIMTLEAAMISYPPKGLIIISNWENLSIGHLTKIRPRVVKLFFDYLQEALPLRLKVLHILNTVSFLNQVMMILKPLMKQETFDMMKFHPKNMDMNDFHKKWIPKQYLPKDFGGDQPSVAALHEKNIEILRAAEPYFYAEEIQRCG